MAQARLKSKMKRADPENFSIHDFLAECKVTDEADSRFCEDDTKQVFEYAQSKGNIEPVFEQVEKQLKSRGWAKKKDDKGRYHLIFGSKYGKSIPFKRFAQLFKWDYGIKPHCNYYRGYESITKLSNLVFTLRKYTETASESNNQIEEDDLSFQRRSFVFCPAKPEENEKELENFVAAYESNAKRGTPNMWSVEPVAVDHGVRFNNTLSDDYDTILETAYPQDIEQDDATAGKSAFVVREYVCEPLLLPGGQKFELSTLVLIDHEFQAHMSRDIDIIQCDSKFDISHPANLDSHWPSVGASIMPGEQFQKWFASEFSRDSYQGIIEQCKDAISTIVTASKRFLQTVEHGDFTAFQLFQFHFIIDSNFRVSIERVEAAPTIDPSKLEEVAREVTELAIDPLFSGTRGRGSLFEPLSTPREFSATAAPSMTRRNKK